MAKIAWGMGWSVSQAQGRMVRPTANMERAADHLRHTSFVSFFLGVESFWPSSQPLQSHNGEQISREFKSSWYLQTRQEMIDVSSNVQLHYKDTGSTRAHPGSWITHTEWNVDGKVKVFYVPHCAVKLQAENILQKYFYKKVYLISIQRIVMRMVIVRISFVRKRSK